MMKSPIQAKKCLSLGTVLIRPFLQLKASFPQEAWYSISLTLWLQSMMKSPIQAKKCLGLGTVLIRPFLQLKASFPQEVWSPVLPPIKGYKV